MKNNMEAILRIINSDPEPKAKFETAVDNYCNSREWQLILAWKTKKHNLTGDQLEALTFALEWADAHPGWISVKDRKPKIKHSADNMKYSDTVIVTNGKYRTSANWTHNTWTGWYGWLTDGEEELKGITHWMPLPSIEHLKEKEL